VSIAGDISLSDMSPHRCRFARDNSSVSMTYGRGKRRNPYGGVGRVDKMTLVSALSRGGALRIVVAMVFGGDTP
jgi:hypothetical protein